jgi:2-amino-4-hydroxy-6-hydroxymethyldihydropteridine diphosphokinase
LSAVEQNNAPDHQVIVSLGSNIDPENNLRQALQALRTQLRVLAVSSVWETKPVTGHGPNYLNAAASIGTQLDAGELKETVLRRIEDKLGRIRGADNHAPRTIDLDIVLFDDEVIDPHLFDYAHLAVPVAEILPGHAGSLSGENLTAVAARLTRLPGIRRTEMRLD